MFLTLESHQPYFCCNLRHNVMPYMYSEMQNKLSKTRESPYESMGQIISSRCPCTPVGRASGSMTAPNLGLFILVGWGRGFRVLLGPPGLDL